jgi:SSS family solute:Na+ symporter
MLWIPLMAKYAKNEGLYTYLQSVQGYLAPPITAVFLLGLFSKRVNSPGAVAGLVFGFVAGMGKLTIETVQKMKHEDVVAAEGSTLVGAISEFSFLYASGVLFAISVAVVLGVSAITRPPSKTQTQGLTWQAMDRDVIRASWGRWDVMATVIVLLFTFGLYGYFSFWI